MMLGEQDGVFAGRLRDAQLVPVLCTYWLRAWAFGTMVTRGGLRPLSI